ncbi:NAD-dependent deacetylase [Rhodococcus sp. NPDC059234]|uniref:SIR2 family NAD-dependent protein deacylase n=1 Tax=Rhodococcus sp. NPDC059234 TaxID=3346781 RepID=UPI0036719C28
MRSAEPDSALVDTIRSARRVVVFSGAGMSAESGVPTFRDALTGLWERFDPVELATPQAWARDSALVWAWYQWRAALVRRTAPNPGHRALAEWSRRTPLTVVTQNVDDLHERAGSVVAAHLHGSLFAPRCADCGTPADPGFAAAEEFDQQPVERIPPPECIRCGGLVRPGVVWFGEELPERDWRAASDAADGCDLMLVVGTSGVVHPAAELPLRAVRSGATVVEINPETTELSDRVTYSWRATAAHALPALVAAVVG